MKYFSIGLFQGGQDWREGGGVWEEFRKTDREEGKENR